MNKYFLIGYTDSRNVMTFTLMRRDEHIREIKNVL